MKSQRERALWPIFFVTLIAGCTLDFPFLPSAVAAAPKLCRHMNGE